MTVATVMVDNLVPIPSPLVPLLRLPSAAVDAKTCILFLLQTNDNNLVEIIILDIPEIAMASCRCSLKPGTSDVWRTKG